MGRTKRARDKRQRNSDRPSPSIHHDLYKFLSLRGWRNTNRLTVSTFPSTGRGLFAKRRLSAHELIVELPTRCMISYLTLERDTDFLALFSPDELAKAKSLVTFQSLLALFLQHQKLKGDASEFVAYVRTLPLSFTAPYFCHKSELYHLPESILEKVVEQNESIKRNFQQLMMLVKPEARDDFTLETFKWAHFACNSRSVYMNGRALEPLVDHHNFKPLLTDTPNMALAPLLDLLNHSDQATTKSQLTHAESFIARNSDKVNSGEVQLGYQLLTMQAVKRFEQIFINYGTFNNTKLLLEYGFVLPNNRMDFLEFSLDDVNSYIKNHLELRTLVIPKHKYKFIREHELDQQMFIDASDGLNHNFQAVLSILLVPQNIYNLTQIAFGDDMKFSDIKHHAMEIVKQKKIDFGRFRDGLEQRVDRSASGSACLEYFKEATKLVDKVLEIIESSS